MVSSKYRVLVVEDDAMIRRLTQRALTNEGFACDSAADGNEAAGMLGATDYDVVVTDLRMPNKHGHALSVELLAMDKRPLIFVLTGVLEPRLAKDLLCRGVDDIVFKPVDYSTFAAKVKAFADRRHVHHSLRSPLESLSVVANEEPDHPGTIACRTAAGGRAPGEEPSEPVRVSARHFEDELRKIPEVLTIAPSALHVYRKASADGVDLNQLAILISNHELLADEVLRLANSEFYNRSGERIPDLGRAVILIGQERVGQLTLAANAIAAFMEGKPAWMDSGTFWRRSVAAGLAVERLAAQSRHHLPEDGLALCATLHSLGRYLLGTLFPTHYEHALQVCRERHEPLVEHEQHMFPISQSEVMLDVLSAWGVSRTLCEPLKHASRTFAELAELPDPLRTRTELVKLAELVAHIALGNWEPWELVDVPSWATVDRLRIESVDAVIQEIKANAGGLNAFRLAVGAAAHRSAALPKVQLAYWQAATGPIDFVAETLRATHNLQPPTYLDPPTTRIVTNCLDVPPENVTWARVPRQDDLIICEQEQAAAFPPPANILSLPASYAALCAATTPRGDSCRDSTSTPVIS